MGSNHHEVEIKFRVSNLDSLTSKVKAAGFRLVTPRTHEMNTIFDLPGNTLRASGVLLRLRQYGDKWTLTFKDKSAQNSRHKSRPELETSVQDGPVMAQILASLGFQPTFSYEKYRTEWSDGPLESIAARRAM